MSRIVALVGEDKPHVVLDGLDLRLRGGGGASIVFVAWVATRSVAAAPLVIKVSVEIRTSIVARGATVILIGVLAPLESGFRLLAAVGIGVEHQVDLVMVQNPGCVGVNAIVVYQVLSKKQTQRSSGIFIGMDRSGGKELRFVTGDG